METPTSTHGCPVTDLATAQHLEQQLLGEWARALPCGCVMRVAEVFIEEGWFLTDGAITPCPEHPTGFHDGDAPWGLGPMEGRWFDSHGQLLVGSALVEVRMRAPAQRMAALRNTNNLEKMEWKRIPLSCSSSRS